MEQNNKNIYDIIVIGGGPVGIFAAYYAALRNLKVQLIESLGKLGGQLDALYPEKELINVPGFTEIKASDLIEKLTKQLNSFPISVILNNTVMEINKCDNYFEVKTNKLLTYGKIVIIATGVGSFEPRKLPLNLPESFEKKFISYYVKNPMAYQGLDVAIAGGGDSAIDTALQLINYAKNITIIHRRNTFRALESNMLKIKNSFVNLATPFKITEIKEIERAIEINLSEIKNYDQTKTIKVNRLIVNYGFKASNKFQRSWGLQLDRNLIKVDQKMESSRSGIYAIGDASIYPYKQKILANGFGEVPICINSAIEKFSLSNNHNIHGIVQ